MNIKLCVAFIILLVLMSILNNIYNKYNSACREFFTISEDRTPQEMLDNLTKRKSEITKDLCKLEYYLDESIGFNQMNELSKDAKDTSYSLNSNEKNTKIGGVFDYEDKTVFEKITISEKNEVCEVPRWKPDIVVDKDAIVVYITHLVREYNKHVLLLNEDKTKLLDFITNLKRLLNENLDNKLQAQCDRCTGSDCVTLCATPKLPIIERLKNNQLLIDSKKKMLDKKLCGFIKKYRYVEDVRLAVVDYVKRLNSIWTNNALSETKIRLSYAQPKTGLEASDVGVSTDA
uniref:Uncharacterized protein n=1 Tax=Pyramimonas orientalis virus TaxID=455367 RepID=A0A7L9AYX7_POV01|nr:hypothetical protein HWQ62_00344 [Pyramimonas orientalis virus]